MKMEIILTAHKKRKKEKAGEKKQTNNHIKTIQKHREIGRAHV